MKKRILFFIAGPVPTADELAEAAKIPTKMLRNASQVFPTDRAEDCDGVAGLVPEVYGKFPHFAAASGPVVATESAPEGSPVTEQPATPEAPALTPEQAQREAENEGAKAATVAQLKQALTDLGIEFPATAKKSDLLALFLARA